MQRGTSGGAATTVGSDLRRLLVLGLLTVLAVLLCERWSESAVIGFDDDRALSTPLAGGPVVAPDSSPLSPR